ncbi:MAG: hypothetical protein GX601_20130, partial [Anaerolineales bacterium]|nr:hypothetical protein [Anaerolineales bacterium]
MNRVLALLLVLVLLAACSTPLQDAERQWQASGVTDYRIAVREVHSTWCYYDVAVEVQHGEAVSGTVTAHPGPASDCGLYVDGVVEEPVSLAPAEAARWTVPGLFEIAREWQALAG